MAKNLLSLWSTLTDRERHVLIATLNHNPCYDSKGKLTDGRLQSVPFPECLFIPRDRATVLLKVLIEKGFAEYSNSRREILEKINRS